MAGMNYEMKELYYGLRDAAQALVDNDDRYLEWKLTGFLEEALNDIKKAEDRPRDARQIKIRNMNDNGGI